ncbi:glycosyltransferase family 2 protein [Actinoplanes sp. M2I2]|uniref:glycosyltransferase family 2 protein n=1 Tax=Actinoplanes sp. M2I2 TaxID=1734444 RepID=UPI00202115DD|nr:glycosyltransferase family 2 protein [Actinoplanes sp. M2I2]
MTNDGAERRVPGALYGRTATDLTGALQPTGTRVAYRHAYTRRDEGILRSLGVLHVIAAVALAVYLLLPGNLPALHTLGPVAAVLTVAGLAVMVGMQIIVALRTLVLTFFAARARDPIPMVPPPGLRVAVLTTIVPGKEPVELVMATLRAMLRIRHDGVLDVWLLDEGDDPEVRRRCERLGVRHFSRKGRPEWNQATGQFRARTKHGNHNAWRSVHETEYDVVAQMDPDHVPYPNFLERTLGYFADPDTAFLVAPQVYANLTESFVARGAAELAYLFHGVIQRGGNGRGAPLLIGTNHLYRPAAFRQIDGYQDSIIEDHLTSMVIFGAVNPVTGNAWRGVYTPDVVAVGEGPATYSDFFSQQKRWAYGIWQIARGHSPAVLRRLPLMSQRLSFAALQTHYPTTAISWLGGIFLTGLYLVGGVTITRLPSLVWAALFLVNLVAGLAFVQFTRRFNLVTHERRSWGLSGMVLELATAPVYLAAAAAQLAGRPLAYVVTAKGSAATGDSWRTFRPHLAWTALSAAFIVAGVAMHHAFVSLYIWAGLTIATCLIPVAHLTLSRWSPAQPVIARRRVGHLLMAAGLLTEAQLGELLDRQITTDGPWRRLGDLAVEEGYVTATELAEATGVARRPDVVIGAAGGAGPRS